MARNFVAASSHRIILRLGAGAGLSGAVSMFGIVRAASDGAQGVVVTVGAQGGPLWVLYREPTTISAFNGTTGGATSTTTLLAADGWAFVGFTKSAGNTKARFHIYKYGTNTWTHEDSGTSQNDATPAGSSAIGATTGGGSPWDGDIAIAGAYAANLTDAQVERMPFDLNAWFQVQPNGLWLLDQSAVTQNVADLTGNGANQTALTGTTVAARSVPIFTYGHPMFPPAYVPVAEAAPDTNTAVVQLFRTMHVGKRRFGMRSRGIRFLTPSSTGSAPSPPVTDSSLLLESGDDILLESGDRLLLES